jgi:hypothetical protein
MRRRHCESVSTARHVIPPSAPLGVRQTQPPAIREGDSVVAEDGILGDIEAVVLSERRVPLFMIVRAGSLLRPRYPVVPVSLVTGVDAARRMVEVRGRLAAMRRMPETLPLVL